MFVRKRKNRSGTFSVVVVDKSGGSFREVHMVGLAKNASELARLEAEGRRWIDSFGGQQLIDFDGESEKEAVATEHVISNITSTRLCAPMRASRGCESGTQRDR